MQQLKAKFPKKASDLTSRSMKKPPPYISRGAFGIIYSCSQISVQPYSYVQIGADGIGNAVRIGGTLSHDIKTNGDLCVYLDVKLQGGSISSANIVGDSQWWDIYPFTRKFNEGNGTRTPENQINYYFPVAYCGGSYSDRGVIITTCVGGTNTAVCLERFIRGDIVLYYGCDGFIAQAAACNFF